MDRRLTSRSIENCVLSLYDTACKHFWQCTFVRLCTASVHLQVLQNLINLYAEKMDPHKHLVFRQYFVKMISILGRVRDTVSERARAPSSYLRLRATQPSPVCCVSRGSQWQCNQAHAAWPIPAHSASASERRLEERLRDLLTQARGAPHPTRSPVSLDSPRDGRVVVHEVAIPRARG